MLENQETTAKIEGVFSGYQGLEKREKKFEKIQNTKDQVTGESSGTR